MQHLAPFEGANQSRGSWARIIYLAEREGFEPSVPLLTAHTISSRAPSASSDISPKIFRDKSDFNSKFRFKCNLFTTFFLHKFIPYFIPCSQGFLFSFKRFVRLRQDTLQRLDWSRRSLAAGMNGVVNRVEARQSEDGSILSTCYDFGLATAQFRFDTPQQAAGSFIV